MYGAASGTALCVSTYWSGLWHDHEPYVTSPDSLTKRGKTAQHFCAICETHWPVPIGMITQHRAKRDTLLEMAAGLTVQRQLAHARAHTNVATSVSRSNA